MRGPANEGFLVPLPPGARLPACLPGLHTCLWPLWPVRVGLPSWRWAFCPPGCSPEPAPAGALTRVIHDGGLGRLPIQVHDRVDVRRDVPGGWALRNPVDEEVQRAILLAHHAHRVACLVEEERVRREGSKAGGLLGRQKWQARRATWSWESGIAPPAVQASFLLCSPETYLAAR